MSNSLRHVGAIIFLAASTAALIPACAPNAASIFIRGCVARTDDTCVASADAAALELFRGRLDSAYGGQYDCPLLVGNQLVPRADPERGIAETSRVQIYAAEVSVLDTQGNVIIRADASPATFTQPVNGFLEPSSGTTAGFGLVDVVLVDAVTAHDLGAAMDPMTKKRSVHSVVASVVLRGRTLGGIEVASGEWLFPVDVGAGWMCDRSPCAPPMPSTDKPLPNCHIGQDKAVDCRYGCLVGP